MTTLNSRFMGGQWQGFLRLASGTFPVPLGTTAKLKLHDYTTGAVETKNLAATSPEVAAQLRATLARHPEPRPAVR